VDDFLLVLIEFFFARYYNWVATSEKRSKIGDCAPTRSVWYKISDGRTAFSSLDRVCIACSAVKTLTRPIYSQSFGYLVIGPARFVWYIS